MSMQARVVEFANLLRKSGVRVSVAEAIDAFEALDELSLGEREVFKDALRTSMIKRGDEIATYDQLFDLFLRYDLGELASSMDGVLLSVNARNIEDKRYVSTCTSEASCFYGQGRVVTARVAYKW